VPVSKQIRRLLLAVVVGLAVIAFLVARGEETVDPVGEPLLPDLWMSEPFELSTEVLDGRYVLRFTSEINNKGRGDLIVRGNPETGPVTQWIQHAGSGFTITETAAQLVWGGDTHDHWHIVDAARYWIEAVGRDLEGQEQFDHKVGFCMFDSVNRFSGLARAPDEVRYTVRGCGGGIIPEITMGLSVGWGDQYRFNLAGQWIDITDLAPGTYRVVAAVDPDGLFTESDRANNSAASEFTLDITDSGERVIAP